VPTKERKQQDRERLAKKQALDKAVSNAPEHIRNRFGQSSKLAESLHTDGQHKAGWAKFDERGQNIKKYKDPEDQGANLERHEDKVARARKIRAKYPSDWGKRGVAEGIAHAENPSVETIRRYMKDFPI
jgi:hypothetical protein